MKRNLLMEQTHCFYFRPKKQGFFEYCLHSDILYKPEESRFGPFVEVIAGLDDNDISRIGIKCFSDMIMANITTIAAPRYEKEKTFTPHTPGISMGGYLNLFVHCRQPNTAFRLS